MVYISLTKFSVVDKAKVVTFPSAQSCQLSVLKWVSPYIFHNFLLILDATVLSATFLLFFFQELITFGVLTTTASLGATGMDVENTG